MHIILTINKLKYPEIDTDGLKYPEIDTDGDRYRWDDPGIMRPDMIRISVDPDGPKKGTDENPAEYVHYDTVRVNVLKIVKIPIGKTATLCDSMLGKIYVPTKWGGELTLFGGNVELFYSDGSDLNIETAIKILNGNFNGKRVAIDNPCSYTVPQNKFKWFYVKCNSKAPLLIQSQFIQEASAKKRPWNFYWWSRKGDFIKDGGNKIANTEKKPGTDDIQVVKVGKPVAEDGDIIRCGENGELETTETSDDVKVTMINLFDKGGALDKYDSIFNTQAKQWELINDQRDIVWTGHCLGGAMASILLEQPKPSASSKLTVEELEGLWAELGETDKDIYEFKDTLVGCPAGPPKKGKDETDKYVSKFHFMLENYINGDGVALQSNLRGIGKDSREAWNHAIWKYSAVFEESEEGNEKQIYIRNSLYANDDHLPPTDHQKTVRFIIHT